MNIELEIIKNVWKKNYKWAIPYVLLVIFQLITLAIRPSSIAITNIDFLSLIGDPFYYNVEINTILLKLLQILLIIFYTHMINSFEYSYALDSFVLRIKKNWTAEKIFLITTTIILISLFLNVFIYLFFSSSLNFEITLLKDSIIYNIFVVVLTITISNFLVVKNQSVFLIISFFISYIALIFYNSLVLVIITVILFLINLLFFQIKKRINQK